MRSTFFVCALLLTITAGAAEDFRVMKLEQDVRNLERQVQTLQRQLNEVQPASSRSDPTYAPRADHDSKRAEGEQRWLNAAAWNRVSTGMSELQVIEILGSPTALRPDAQGRRALLYTLEIGTTGFLTGSVSFADGKAVEIQKPTLK